MRLLTLNCHSWLEENQLDKIKTLAQTIAERSYDVIALQEVNQSLTGEFLSKPIRKDNFAAVLIQELEALGEFSYQFIWDFGHIGYDRFEEGLALLTKHPIKATDSFFISKSHDTANWKTRKVVKMTIEYEKAPLTFFSCHLGWWDDQEEPAAYQMDRLKAKLHSDELTFLMGDFNNDADSNSDGYQYLLKQGLYDTFKLALKKDDGKTVRGKIAGWETNSHDLRIDLILVNQPIEVLKSNVIFNRSNRPIISDHYGVEIEINL
ncbi:MAG TPA: endonuclease/exonuclease/phosphatase family protein [Chondromyces sp.]|nr:endonuclease/exonuclease/phosphatase family protein [Chondromyces sp.]